VTPLPPAGFAMPGPAPRGGRGGRAARGARGDAGFTLAEVLIGALVLGIFISFVYGVVVSGFQVREVIRDSTSSLAGGSTAVDLVASDLQAIFWRPMQDLEAFKAESDGADGTRLDFVAAVESRRQDEIGGVLLRSVVTEVGYALRSTGEERVLYRREQFGVDQKPLEGGDWFKVVGGVEEFRVEFFEKDPTEEDDRADLEEAALEAWDLKEKKKLPRAARIVLALRKPPAPGSDGEGVVYRFTRWVLLPGADDADPKQEDPQNPGQNPPGQNPPPGGGGG
jgi:prepilin-type N-terminal cleavage/methylation domain-containing protein